MLPCEESDVECTRQERTARARLAARGVRGLEVQRAEGRPIQVPGTSNPGARPRSYATDLVFKPSNQCWADIKPDIIQLEIWPCNIWI